MKEKLEIHREYSEECGREINVLYLGAQKFDYLMDEQSLLRARLYCQQNPHLKKAVCGDVLKHFTDCFGEFLGRPVTVAEVNRAIEDGEIDVHR